MSWIPYKIKIQNLLENIHHHSPHLLFSHSSLLLQLDFQRTSIQIFVNQIDVIRRFKHLYHPHYILILQFLQCLNFVDYLIPQVCIIQKSIQFYSLHSHRLLRYQVTPLMNLTKRSLPYRLNQNVIVDNLSHFQNLINITAKCKF